jgi:hypothetical protein
MPQTNKNVTQKTWALLEIDIKIAFNEALRQAAFDVIAGKAPREYDSGKVKPGDDMQSLDALFRFFDYFRAMHDTAAPFDMSTTRVRCTMSRARVVANKATRWR